MSKQMKEEVIYEFKCKPSFLESFTVSNFAILSRPFGLILICIYSIFCGYILSGQKTPFEIVFFTITTLFFFFVLIESIILLQLFILRKRILQEISMTFTNSSCIGERKNYKIETKYDMYNKIKVHGNKILLISKDIRLSWFKLTENINKTEFVNFLIDKIQSK